MAEWDYPRPHPKIAASDAPTGSDTVEPQQERGQPMANDRVWDGKAVYARGDSKTPRRPIAVALTEQGARTVALALARLKQTTLTLPGDAQELLLALDYVMVADPASVRAHREMEAGKGMTPDGGFKEPENLSRLEREAREGAELNPDRRTDGQRAFNEQMGWMQ